MKKVISILFALSSISVAAAQGDSLQRMEQELVFLNNTAAKSFMFNHTTEYDLEVAPYSDLTDLCFQHFEQMLNVALVADRNMTWPFAALRDSGISGTDIITSRDSLLRVLSWELPGGTMHFYGNAVQYKNGASVVGACSLQIADGNYTEQAGYDYTKIYTLKNNSKTIYILSGSTNFSTRIVGYQLLAFSIGDELVAENIFEDEAGKTANQLAVAYDIAESYDYLPVGDFPCPEIDEQNRLLRVPEVMCDSCSNSVFTGRYIQYRFDGQKFMKIKKLF